MKLISVQISRITVKQMGATNLGMMSSSKTVAEKESGFCSSVFLWFAKWSFSFLFFFHSSSSRAISYCSLSWFQSWHCWNKDEVSISLHLPEAIRGVSQNWCLSAADLKWVHDGNISGRVFENTITFTSRLNHSPLCDDISPPKQPHSPHLQRWSPVHAVEVYYNRRMKAQWAVMHGPGAKTTPIAYQLPISTFLVGCQRVPHSS